MYDYPNGRPEEEKRPDPTTVFHRRPGEQINRTPIRGWKNVVLDFVPSILLKLSPIASLPTERRIRS